MPIYTVVDEGYVVDAYRTLNDLCSAHADPNLFVVPQDEFDDEAPLIPASAYAIKKALRLTGEALISEDGGRDWKYKITKHT